jgi:hypothetical protein
VIAATNLAKAVRDGLRPTLLGAAAGAFVSSFAAVLMDRGVIGGEVVTLVVLAVTPQVVVAMSRAAGGLYGSMFFAGLLAGAIGGAVLGWIDYHPCTERSQLPPGFVCGDRVDAARVSAGLFGTLGAIVAALSGQLWSRGPSKGDDETGPRLQG